MLPLDRAASIALGFVVMVMVVVVMAVVDRLGGGVGRVVVMMVMVMAVVMPTVHCGGAGNHSVVERFHTRTDAAGDRPFLTTGPTQESEQRLRE
jgi:hypothetical protein